MVKKTNKQLIVGLEIGTTKIVALVGEIVDNNIINIIGIGINQSIGINQGIINDLKSTTKHIKEVINQAESMANCKISSVYLAISNKYIHCQNEIGIIPISKKEITKEDVQNVIYTAKCVRIRNEHKILHTIPQEYSIDQYTGIKNPIGLSGIRMKARVHIITCYNEIIKNIIKSVEICGINVDYLIFSGLASSEAILTKDDRQLGVCIADIGGGTTDISIYINNILEHSCVIPYAGNSVTNDISYAFNIPFLYSEQLKIKYGYAIKPPDLIYDKIEPSNIDKINIKQFNQNMLTEIIEPRYTELLNLINFEIKYVQKKISKFENNKILKAGLVLTGGATNIKHLEHCAKKIFDIPIRIDHPKKISNSTSNDIKLAQFSTVIGLLYYGKKYYHKYKQEKSTFSLFKQWFSNINNWIKKEL